MTIIVRADDSGLAPWHSRYYAIDDDTYDGAEDSSNRHQVGRGASPDEAYAALCEILLDDGELTHDEYRAMLAVHGLKPYLDPDRLREDREDHAR